jgi:hypothetical protein
MHVSPVYKGATCCGGVEHSLSHSLLLTSGLRPPACVVLRGFSRLVPPPPHTAEHLVRQTTVRASPQVAGFRRSYCSCRGNETALICLGTPFGYYAGGCVMWRCTCAARELLALTELCGVWRVAGIRQGGVCGGSGGSCINARATVSGTRDQARGGNNLGKGMFEGA